MNFSLKNILSGSLMAALLLTACNKTLDIKPPFDTPTDVALNSADNLEAAVNGAYAALQSASFYGGALRITPDALSDHTRSVSAALERGNLTYYDIYRRFLFAQGNGIWTTGYQAINRANNVLNAIENENEFVTDQTDAYRANKNRLLGESYFVRAVAHWELVRLYGTQFGINSDAEQSGVVLRLKPSQGREPLARATTDQVYAQVEADLTRAIDLLPEDYQPGVHPVSYGGRRGGRATKDAARAMLAKVLFQKGTAKDNDDALVLINTVIGSATGSVAKYPLDPIPNTDAAAKPTTVFAQRGNNIGSETIYQIVNNADAPSRSLNSTAATLAAVYTERIESGALPPVLAASDSFRAEAGQRIFYGGTAGFVTQFDSPDRRRRLFFNESRPEGTSQNLLWVDKYYVAEDITFGAVPIFNIPIVRSAELLLDRAEINALKGNLTEALADLNALRTARIDPAPNVTPDIPSGAITSREQLIRIIRAERVRELGFEGDRLHDLRRRAALERKGVTTGLAREEMSSGGTGDRLIPRVNVFDRQLLLLIPDNELFANPAIRQN